MANSMSAQHTPGPCNEDADMVRRHVVADVLSARNAHRTAQYLERKGFPAEYAQQARALRDASLRGARRNLDLYRAKVRAAIAKVTGSDA